MVNFQKLKSLIAQQEETSTDKERLAFYERLKAIASYELSLKQVTINDFFKG